MNAMIERVAQAIHKAAHGVWAGEAGDEDRALARAAIEAMREPTEAMCRAGGTVVFRIAGAHGEPEPVWKAMVDEALK